YHGKVTVFESLAIYPLKNNNKTLGFIVIMLEEKKLSDFDKEILNFAIDVLSISLLNEKKMFNMKQNLMSDIINIFFTDKQKSIFINSLEPFNINENIGCFLILFVMDSEEQLEKLYNIIFNMSDIFEYKPLLTSRGVVFFTNRGKKDVITLYNNLVKQTKNL